MRRLHPKIVIGKHTDPALTSWSLCCFVKDLPGISKSLKRKKPRLTILEQATNNLIMALSGTDPNKKIFCTFEPSVNGTRIDLRVEPDPPKVVSHSTMKLKKRLKNAQRRGRKYLDKALKELEELAV